LQQVIRLVLFIFNSSSVAKQDIITKQSAYSEVVSCNYLHLFLYIKNMFSQ